MPRHRTISLRPIAVDDIPILLTWRNSGSFRDLCSNRKTVLTEQEFCAELRRDFQFDRCEQVIILVNGAPAGTAFAYRYSPTGKNAFVSIFLDETHRGHAIGVYALANFVTSIFDRLDLYKVYFETYSYNKPVVRLLSRLGLSPEGNFRGHCVHLETHHDLLVFALYRDVADRIGSTLPTAAVSYAAAIRVFRDVLTKPRPQVPCTQSLPFSRAAIPPWKAPGRVVLRVPKDDEQSSDRSNVSRLRRK